MTNENQDLPVVTEQSAEIEKNEVGLEALVDNGPSSENVQELTPEQEWEMFLADPVQKENAYVLATQIQECVGKNWFSFDRFIKKTKEDRMVGYQKLSLAEAFGFVKRRIGEAQDGKENIRKPLFKVVFTKEDKVYAINAMIQYHKNQIERLESEKKGLQ